MKIFQSVVNTLKEDAYTVVRVAEKPSRRRKRKERRRKTKVKVPRGSDQNYQLVSNQGKPESNGKKLAAKPEKLRRKKPKNKKDIECQTIGKMFQKQNVKKTLNERKTNTYTEVTS